MSANENIIEKWKQRQLPNVSKFGNYDKLSPGDMERISSKIDGDIFGTRCALWKNATCKMNGGKHGRIFFGYGRNKNGVRYKKAVVVSRLLYHNFVAPLNAEKPSILHRCNTNGKCCTLQHLYAGTPAENNRDMIEHGNAHYKPGKQGKRKLTEDDVQRIRKRLNDGAKGVTVAKEFSVCQHTISRIRTCAKRGGWKEVK